MLQSLIKPQAVNVDLQSEDKDEVFEEMTETLIALCPGLDRSEVLQSLLSREAKMTTGIIPGIAVPHAICTKVKNPVCAVGISKKGIDFDSLDGKPVHIIFMSLFPENDTATHLGIMQEFAYIFDEPNFYRSIMEKSTPEQVVQAIILAEDNL